MSERRKPASENASAAASSGADNAVLQFADNALAQALFGSHHSHIALIEQRLPVTIRPRGNTLAVAGPAEAIGTVRAALGALYRRLERGLAVDLAEVEAALRMAAAPSGPADFESLAVRTRTRLVTPRTPMQAAYLRAIDESELVFGEGPAGTGKTYLAVAKAVERLVRGEVDRIILSRPAVEAGEQLGFLPGSMREKVDPYLRPLYDALYDMLPAPQVVKRLESGEIEVAPLAFMRGRTLTNAFAILDEAQNTTAVQMKMFLTRLGEGSRMVVTGDLSQVDLPRGIRSGLRHATETLTGVEGVSFVEFTDVDVVRHPLVSRIVRAYDRVEKRRGSAAQYEHENEAPAVAPRDE